MHIESLAPGEVFVFGSNAQGAHGAGAARTAYEKFGAVWGQGSGLQGQSYGIDTMSGFEVLRREVAEFVSVARQHPELTFLLTPVGCGIAGYAAADVAPLFTNAPGNVELPAQFRAVIEIPDAGEHDDPAGGAPSEARAKPSAAGKPGSAVRGRHDRGAAGDRQQYWDGRYGDSPRLWSGRVNAALADVTADLVPGTALDLGCGEGGDALWLAEHGWRVTGVDVSTVALERADAEARRRGLDIAWQSADLESWQPRDDYDLVSACFLQAPEDFNRSAVLHRMSRCVRPGGHLLIVSHAAMPPWSQHHDHADMPTIESELAAVGAPTEWTIVIAEKRQRAATGPDGQHGLLDDNVVLLLRR